MSQPSVAVTMGDPAGISPEIVARAFAEPQMRKACRPVVVGDPRIMFRAMELVKNRFNNLEQTSGLLTFYKKLCNGC